MNFLNKFRNLYSLTTKENLDSIINELEENKRNIIAVFDEVSSDKPIHLYKLELLAKKVSLIIYNQSECGNKYANYVKNAQTLIKLRPKMIWPITALVTIFYVFSLFPSTAIIYTFLLFPVQLLLLKKQIDIYNNINEIYKNLKNVKDDVEKTVRETNNTAVSCNNFISKKWLEYNKALIGENANLIPMWADMLIVDYLETGTIKESRKDVLNYAVELLQCELESTEVSLKKLLELYQQKANIREYEESNLVRTRNVNKEASKKK